MSRTAPPEGYLDAVSIIRLMKIAALCLFIVSFLAQVYGAYAVVKAAGRARTALNLGPRVGEDTDGVPYFAPEGDDGSTALRAVAVPWLGLAAIGLGILTGFLGNVGALL